MSLLLELGRKADTRQQAFFRFREVAGKFVVTSVDGSYVVLERDEMIAFAEGRVERSTPLWERLREASLLRAELDVDRAAERMRQRYGFIHTGPNLHMLVVTLRCNETCVYCHASRADMDAVHTDMTIEIAEKSVDLALSTTSPWVTIEFQGGEPLVNFPVVQHAIQYAQRKNEGIGKTLEFTMVSNLSLMDDAKLEWLVANKVQICTSVDGPEHLHDKQRKLPGFSAHGSTVTGVRRINAAYEKMGLDPLMYRVEALLTTTRDTLPRWKEVVDTYAELGCRALFLRPVDPFGFMDKTGPRLEYPRAEYLAFYRSAVDYMIELNLRGVQILERYAAIFLTKILTGVDPNFLDIRSPGGAGIGAIAYNWNGKIFSSDEGRMLHERGDDTFQIGDVRTSTYRELVGHETVRAEVIASLRDAQPDCVNCAYNPYCGVPPVYSHKAQGTLWGRMRDNPLCAVHKGIQDYLFEKIIQNDPGTMDVFRRWTTSRPRTHFLHEPGGISVSASRA